MNAQLHVSTDSFYKSSSAKDGGREGNTTFLAASFTTFSITRKNKGVEMNLTSRVQGRSGVLCGPSWEPGTADE